MNIEQNKQAVLAGLRSSFEVHRVLGQGDLVVTHSTVHTENDARAVAFDLWQLDDGQIVGHWENQEPWAADTANGHSQVDGVKVIDLSADTHAAEELIKATVQTILIDNDFSSLDSYLAGDDYIQHNPRFADGVSGLAAALAALAEQGVTMKYSELLHTVAEGDFVYAHSNGTFGGTEFVFHDLFRVANGRAVEHWDVMVPAAE
jgi:predicted SnoaL-like aldol condensation-catalyzing enzyme